VAGNKSFLELEDGSKLECEFNPAQLELNRTNKWTADPMPGKGVSQLRYEGAQSGTLSLELFFDTTATGKSVTDTTSKLMSLMDVAPGLTGSDPATNNVRPPWVKFHWGDMHSFKAVVSSLNLSFIYFTSKGVPLRARANLTLLQYEEEKSFGPQNPTSGTPNPHRVHQVRPGESLDRIAAVHYGDATRWRTIADANGVEDPLNVRPGTTLSIPRLES
jgi:hypothetical protein